MLTSKQYELFELFLKRFDEWAEAHPEEAFKLFTGIDPDKLINVKDVPFEGESNG